MERVMKFRIILMKYTKVWITETVLHVYPTHLKNITSKLQVNNARQFYKYIKIKQRNAILQ